MAKDTVKKEEKKLDKATVSKKVSSKKTEAKVTKEVKEKKAKKSDVVKSSKKASADTKSSKKASSATSKKTTASKSSNKSTDTKKTSSTRKPKSTAKPMLPEYYDLPYRYNQTTVKILAQTPTTLFVYWDISDADREALLEKHGENMFYDTKPILIVHNTTKNYSFEIEINDFANSWYIRTQEPDCDYVIELGRRDIKKPSEYIYIQSSNNITSPNDHVLFEKADLGHVVYRNAKTNVLSSKDFGSLRFINDIDKLYGNIYDVYSRLYEKQTLEEITNPSSGEFIKK